MASLLVSVRWHNSMPNYIPRLKTHLHVPSSERQEPLSEGVKRAELSQAGWKGKIDTAHLDQEGCPGDSKVDFHTLLRNRF